MSARGKPVQREAFEKLVAEALRSIPKRFRKEMRNIAIIVEDEPSRELLHEMGIKPPDTLILHGRRICRPKPLCDQCFIVDDCDYFRLVVSREGRTRKSGPAKKARKTATPVGADLRVRPKKKPRGTKRVRKARR